MNDETIWSKYGILSLSKKDPFFGQGRNYWRGAIWINIHYMILRAIKLYYWSIPELKEFYL
jgi:mannosyl-oligosaccharide glucosidase